MSPACRRSCTPCRATARRASGGRRRRRDTAADRDRRRRGPGRRSAAPARSTRIAWSAASGRSRCRCAPTASAPSCSATSAAAAAASRPPPCAAPASTPAPSGVTSPAALDKARQGCSGKECLPYQLIWGTLAELPRARRRHHRRGRPRVRQHRPRLSGLPGQPVPGRPADPARAPRLRRRRRGGRLHAALRGLVADLGGVGRLGGRRPAQHDALLPLRRPSRAAAPRTRSTTPTPTASRRCWRRPA